MQTKQEKEEQQEMAAQAHAEALCLALAAAAYGHQCLAEDQGSMCSTLHHSVRTPAAILAVDLLLCNNLYNSNAGWSRLEYGQSAL
jgi:hypothetical protein